MTLKPLALAAALLAAALAVQAQTSSGIDRAGIDASVRVQDDLFPYAQEMRFSKRYA